MIFISRLSCLSWERDFATALPGCGVRFRVCFDITLNKLHGKNDNANCCRFAKCSKLGVFCTLRNDNIYCWIFPCNLLRVPSKQARKRTPQPGRAVERPEAYYRTICSRLMDELLGWHGECPWFDTTCSHFPLYNFLFGKLSLFFLHYKEEDDLILQSAESPRLTALCETSSFSIFIVL